MTYCARCRGLDRVRLGADKICPVCGVAHATPCDECGQAGYHARDCSQSDEPRHADRPRAILSFAVTVENPNGRRQRWTVLAA